MIGTRLVNIDQLKEQIAERVMISEVAEKIAGVELHSSGVQQRGLCPLHEEDTPSFYVSDTKGLFTCFGCKEGGDSIQLVRGILHVSFFEALERLARLADIDIQEYQRPPTPEEEERDKLRDWCENIVAEVDPAGDPRLTGHEQLVVAKQYGVGRFPARNGHSASGFFKDKEYLLEGTVFPYRTPNGRLVGWKVRNGDKTFGTPNGFPLSEPTLFGIQVARNQLTPTDALVVVEGEYDALTVAGAGVVPGVVAMGGSAFTEEHMAMVTDCRIREIIFWLDGDTGGITAAMSIAKRYWHYADVAVKIVVCPEGMDPDDLVLQAGADMAHMLLDGAKGALEWLLWTEYSRIPRRTLTSKLDFLQWLQSEYGTRLTGLHEAVILREVAKWMEVPEADVLDFARVNKTMLQVPDSEKVVIGKSLRDVNYYIQTRKRIGRDDFFMMKHRRLWDELENLLAEGLDFDPVTIRTRAESQGVPSAYVDILLETGDLNIGWHEDQMVDIAIRRSARSDADRFREIIGDLAVPANQLIGSLTHSVTSTALGRGSGAFQGIVDQVDEAMTKVQERMQNPDGVYGLDLGTQFPLLTRNLQGLQPRRFVLVAATSGRGKSTLGGQFLVSLSVAQQVPTDFISLEMDSDEIIFKMVSHLTGIDSMLISGGRLTEAEAKLVEQGMMRIRKSPLRIYAPSGITPDEFVLYAREAVMERRSEVFVIDYAQMVGPDAETHRQSRYEQLGNFAYKAKQKIARGLDTTVIAMAQLKRDAAGKDEPTPEDMGDSYDLVRAADVILLINEQNDIHELWIGKNRQGPGGQNIPISYDKPTNTMREFSGSSIPSYRIIG